jgi:hypothetical protein
MKKAILFLAMLSMFLFAGVTSLQAQPRHHGGGQRCRERCDETYRCHERCQHARHHRRGDCIRRCHEDRANCHANCGGGHHRRD